MVHATGIAAKVAAVNATNKYAIEIYPTLRAIFEPFVGQQINKADGTFLKKIAKLIPEFPCTPTLHVYKYSSDYSLVWMVKACETYSSDRKDSCYGAYHETGVYVGHMRDGVLTSFYDAPVLRTDYTVEEIGVKREEYRIAKKIADDCFSALHPFGEYDR